jgi:hypothetical protein
LIHWLEIAIPVDLLLSIQSCPMPTPRPSSRPPPSFLRRLSMAFSVLLSGEAPQPDPQPQTITLKEASPEAALQLLALLQREARLIDFVQEDIAGHTDADVGAAARLVHEGCRKVLQAHFTLAPVRSEEEGRRLTLPAGFDAAAVRLTGNVVGQAPFTGTLSHRGWRVTEVRLPQLAEHHDAAIVAQAEVEL